MRILHLSTYDIDGGAARAAFRTHESLLAAGHQSSMLVRTKHSNCQSVQDVPRRICSGSRLADLIQKHYLDQNRTELSTTCFSLGWPGEDLSRHPWVEQTDIIHLHWVSGLVSPESLRALFQLSKPIVWSLHDQRAYTGGCHYSAGCTQFETNCAACPQLVSDPCGLTAANLADQLRTVATPAITIIAPSRWMAQCARRSAVFAAARIEVLPYGIDTNRFRPIPQPEARARLVLPQDSFLLLFGVDNAGEKRKGLRELFAVAKSFGEGEYYRQLAPGRKPSLMCFGDLDSVPELPIPVRTFGRIRSDELLSCLYSAADLFLLPSLEDNLPNTVLEAMSCGTPVGAFNVGGVPDMVVHGQTGFLAPAGDLKRLRDIIGNSVQDAQRLKEMRSLCRRHVETHFTYTQHARACLTLYEDLLRKTRPCDSSLKNGTPPPVAEDAGPNFQNIFAPVLKHVFDLNPDLPFASCAGTAECRGAQFRRKAKRTLKRAVKQSWTYPSVRAALDVDFAMLQGKSNGSTRLKLFLKRMLRRS